MSKWEKFGLKKKYKKPKRLTVIIHNQAPLVHLGEPAEHRRVTIKLTPEQSAKLARESVDSDGMYEGFGQIVLED